MKRKKILAYVLDDGSVVRDDDFLGVDEEYILSFGEGILYKNKAELRLILAIVKIQRQEQREKSHNNKVRAGATPKKSISKEALIESLKRYSATHDGEMRGWVTEAMEEFSTTAKTLALKRTLYKIKISDF